MADFIRCESPSESVVRFICMENVCFWEHWKGTSVPAGKTYFVGGGKLDLTGEAADQFLEGIANAGFSQAISSAASR